MFSKYAQYYDILNSQKPYKKEIEFVYKWAGKPKTILDLGAGTASYWKYYPKETQILGVDKSQSMVRKDRQVICADITTYKHLGNFDCVTALFDVINYIPKHDWWVNIPIEKGGYFIFDIWDKKKVDAEGFQKTFKRIGTVSRVIEPISYDGKTAKLEIEVVDGAFHCEEIHTMYIYSNEDIKRFCGNEFVIDAIKPTKRWQTWYRLKKR